MKKNINASSLAIILLSVAFVIMSVGFAAYSQRLDINGTAVAKKASWNVRFKTDSYLLSEGSVSATTNNLTATTMTYNVTLNPGEFYEFTVDIENAGTFDANLKALTMSELTTEQKEFIKYTVTYDSTNYEVTTLDINNTLATESSKKVKVRVEYILPADATKLPTAEDVTLNLSANFDFEQKA